MPGNVLKVPNLVSKDGSCKAAVSITPANKMNVCMPSMANGFEKEINSQS